MATRIISVLNQKGGVGKTTTCVNLGAALARRGQEVLLVDMDPQANLTVHVGIDPRTVERSTYSLLLGRHGLGESVRPTSTAGLSVLPSTLALANVEIQLASAVGRELILRDSIDEFLGPQPSPKADFVLIDCPPSLGILTMNALCASTDVLLPIQAEFFALQGVAGILESLKAVQRLNRGLKLSIVVPCMVDKRKTLARDVIEEVRRYFGNLVTQTVIRANVKLAEAPSHGKTIFEYDASSNGAKDYASLAGEVLGEVEVPPDDEEPFAETAAPPSGIALGPAAMDDAPAQAAAPPAPAVPAEPPPDAPQAVPHEPAAAGADGPSAD
jgi:chromosome partitioning protein